MRTWEELSEPEHTVMILAGEEGMLWEVCAALEPEPSKRGAEVVSEAQSITGTLARDGLLWFYQLGEGNPSMSEADVVTLFNTPDQWLRDAATNTAANICLYATADGERLLKVQT